jgi:glutathione peroxidase
MFISLSVIASAEKIKSFHDFKVKTIDNKVFDLATLKGKKIIVINTASKCGLTPQYKILQEIYNKLDKSKFEMIAFPANNFLKQEPDLAKQIQEFCTNNFQITFPIMDKVSVADYIYNSYPPDPGNAEKTTTSEIYQWLTKKSLNGIMDISIKWNFHKILIDENGKVIGDLAPQVANEILVLKNWFDCQ